MTLAIYKCYSESRKSGNHLKQTDLPEALKKAEEHKANIVMDKILEYIHIDIDPEEETETCLMEGKTLIEFARWIQNNLNEKKI